MNIFKLKKIEGISLKIQLVIITAFAVMISAVSFGIILPTILNPFYESNIYDYLKQPAEFLQLGDNKTMKDVAYIMKTQSGATFVSNNFAKVFTQDTVSSDILAYITAQYGKFKYNGNVYYYYLSDSTTTQIIVLTDDKLIMTQENELLSIMLPTMLATIAITSCLTFCWSNYVVNKIKLLKKKTELLATNKYIAGEEYVIDDELSSLNTAIDITQKELKSKEEYKNFMFQNLSHELKTPLTVIESYIEAIDDDIVDTKEAFLVIKDEAIKLRTQVQTIMQFNKIDYVSQTMEIANSKVHVADVIEQSVQTYSHMTKEIIWQVNEKDKNVDFTGTQDMWQTVIDNILSNYIRYAKNKIEITIAKDKLILFNDGEQIEKDVMLHMFTPYVKGTKGQNGLGLSISKRITESFGYNLVAKNIQNGVEMTIQKIV